MANVIKFTNYLHSSSPTQGLPRKDQGLRLNGLHAVVRCGFWDVELLVQQQVTNKAH